MDADAVIGATRRWVEDVVIGLNLCPFARRVFVGDRIGYAVTDVTEPRELRAVLAAELQKLVETPIDVVETTLLIHPHALPDFLDFNDFTGDADDLLVELDLDGIIQIAGFHPDYRFADTAADAVENYTNRSPFPMLHLLREDSVTAVAGDPDALLAIPERNIAVLRALGADRVKALRDGGRPQG